MIHDFILEPRTSCHIRGNVFFRATIFGAHASDRLVRDNFVSSIPDDDEGVIIGTCPTSARTRARPCNSTRRPKVSPATCATSPINASPLMETISPLRRAVRRSRKATFRRCCNRLSCACSGFLEGTVQLFARVSASVQAPARRPVSRCKFFSAKMAAPIGVSHLRCQNNRRLARRPLFKCRLAHPFVLIWLLEPSDGRQRQSGVASKFWKTRRPKRGTS